MAPKGSYKLCTVNTAPDRAKRLVGRVIEDVKEEYTILHVENAESMFGCHLDSRYCFRELFPGIKNWSSSYHSCRRQRHL